MAWLQWEWAVLAVAGMAALFAALAWRRSAHAAPAVALFARLEALEAALRGRIDSAELGLAGRAETRDAVLDARLDGVGVALERQDRALREELHTLRRDTAERLDQLARAQGERLQSLAHEQGEQARGLREETAAALARNALALGERFDGFERRLAQSSERLSLAVEQLRERASEDAGKVREQLETRLRELQQGNEAKLEQMRATVDEKLHATLETRLGESFRLVSERLEQVHAGLGEMRTLASGVGDLKRVLGNVKTRGVLGEAQLAALLDELLTVDQYASNVATRPGSSERVEFAVKLPGNGEQPLWLPIDAKFPREDFERLLDAQERADAEAAAEAGQALEQRIRGEAKKIAEKYLAPPHTTDFAVLFLPTEGLYAEVLRRPGLFEAMQRDHRVVIAGPTTLSALLNSLRMGFRTLAIEQRSSEVWQVLGAVRNEFGKFGGVLDKVQKQIGSVSNTLTEAGTRSRAIERKLRAVESVSGDVAQRLLGDLGSAALEAPGESEDV